MKGDIKEMKSDLKAVKRNTDTIPQTLDEIKGLREDIQPRNSRSSSGRYKRISGYKATVGYVIVI